MQPLVVIPARYESSRFPGKPLKLIAGVPMIVRVCRQAAKAVGQENVIVATDDERILRVVQAEGFKVELTPPAKTGSDRVYLLSTKVSADAYINIQGDEPFVEPEDIRLVIREKEKFPDVIVTAVAPLEKGEGRDRNVVKAIVTSDNRLMWLTRADVPATYRHCGLYAFSKKELEEFHNRAGSEVEDIELTRMKSEIRVVVINRRPAVDVPGDIERCNRWVEETTGGK